ncbi:MAG: LytTR family DNA-binding domain-containing protein [Clostridia bacterium]|nr:LytTR family DNA-binding domain-containing protein [Clostridia bacterium]
MLRVIIAEDDPYMVLVLRGVLNGLDWVKIECEVGNGRDLIEKVEELKPDVVFLDIMMPEINGIDAAKKIFKSNPEVFIIFATAYSNYMYDAFNVYACDYLIKPFDIQRIYQTLSRIKEKKEKALESAMGQKQKINICSNGITYCINTEDIVMVTRIGRRTYIYTTKQIISTYTKLSEIENLIGKNFFRCHKGYIINKAMIKEILPYGKKTYLVKLNYINETSLMTVENYKLLKKESVIRSYGGYTGKLILNTIVLKHLAEYMANSLMPSAVSFI